MFYELKKNLRKTFFDINVSDIFNTPPIICSDIASFSILSQIRPSDIKSYLLAIKSFSYYLKPSSIYVVGDRFTESDWKTLDQHIDNLIRIPIETVNTMACPHGGTWERIFSILELTHKHYIIQIDSDTLTMLYPTEIAECINLNVNFTLGTSLGQNFSTCVEASNFASQFNEDTHVQTVSEKALASLDNSDNLLYVRGCSGLSGFAHNDVTTNDAEYFSTSMEKIIGSSKWKEWGSEQITSNFLISNSKNKMVLPWPKYCNFNPDNISKNSTFIHFIGNTRYALGTYRKYSKKIIKILLTS